MEVHFCDLCNESVPQRDLDQGRAFLRKGRVICAACDLAMGGEGAAAAAAASPKIADDDRIAGAETALGLEGPASPVPAGSTGPGATGASPGAATATGAHHAAAAPAGSGLAMVLAAMAILLTASVAVLLFERMNEAGLATNGELKSIRGEVRSELDGVRDDLALDQRSRAEELRRIGTELATLATRVEERDKQNLANGEKLAAEIAAIGRRLDAAAGLSDRVTANEMLAAEHAETLAQMGSDIGVIASAVEELASRPAVVVQTPAGGGAESAEPAADAPEWMSLVADLQSPSSGARWAAVSALGDTKDPGVIPHLVPMFADTDLFVRMATARVLGDLGSFEPCPALIDALEDEEASVREAAVISLRKLTGEAFGFDPTGNQAERGKKVKVWRDWWKKKGSSALGRA